MASNDLGKHFNRMSEAEFRRRFPTTEQQLAARSLIDRTDRIREKMEERHKARLEAIDKKLPKPTLPAPAPGGSNTNRSGDGRTLTAERKLAVERYEKRVERLDKRSEKLLKRVERAPAQQLKQDMSKRDKALQRRASPDPALITKPNFFRRLIGQPTVKLTVPGVKAPTPAMPQRTMPVVQSTMTSQPHKLAATIMREKLAATQTTAKPALTYTPSLRPPNHKPPR